MPERAENTGGFNRQNTYSESHYFPANFVLYVLPVFIGAIAWFLIKFLNW